MDNVGPDEGSEGATRGSEQGAGNAPAGEREGEPEAGERKPERVADPRMPSRAEVEEHGKTHLPYRSWCKHCVRGRGVEEPHRKRKEEVGIPELHMDFMFLGDEGTNRN